MAHKNAGKTVGEILLGKKGSQVRQMNKPAALNDRDLTDLLDLLDRLEAAKIHFTLARHQEDAITIEVAVPGQRWEID